MMFALSVTGPTASGKTALSLELADRLSGEIVSSDSMQIYKYMSIGTAKATEDEQARAVHHMIDFLDPRENYSVEAYRKDAIDCVRDITSRGKTPIFVGGTGLYIDALLRAPQTDVPESDPEYRASLLEAVGGDPLRLWQRLAEVDPESAEKTHSNNVKRVIRALEIYDKTGIRKSELDRRSKEYTPEIYLGMIALDFHNRETLYERVNRRVDIMMRDGLLDEVSELYKNGFLDGSTTASQAIGYKELREYLIGECTLAESVETIKLSSRRYAKRQLTWWRGREDVKRIFCDDENGRMRDINDVTDEACLAYKGFLGEYEKLIQIGN